MALGISAAGWAAIGTTAVGVYSANKQAGAAKSASNQQSDAAQAGIAEQQRQFDAIQKLLQPYVTAGTGALTQQQDLLGLNGNASEQKAIQAIQSSPVFTSALQQGEKSILSNAAATGGLRGGNVQSALAQFSPQLLAQAINDQYGRLGSLSSLGQNAAAGVGNAGMSTGSSIANLLQQQGAAQAGGTLAGGAASSGYLNSLLGGLGMYSAFGRLGAGATDGAGVVSGGNGLTVGGW